MMKTIHTLWMALALTAMCSFFTACSDDREPQWNPEISEGEDLPTVGDGQFVVSYGASDGTSTRALSDVALPANERISSLHYYVYEKKTGELIKRRKIRGINKDTKWPINDRNKMSWELRQDLQDTLTSGYTYRILFIANIDPTLFKKADGSKHPAVVRNYDKYETAKILLPEVPFSDNNMYYLWEDTLNAKADTTIKRKDVLLRRLVTRTDVERKNIGTSETELNTYLSTLINTDLYHEKNIENAFNAHLDDFCKKMPELMTGDYHTNADTLANYLKKSKVRKKLYDSLKENVIKQFTDALKAGLFTSVSQDWNNTKSVKLSYQSKSRCNAISFERKALYLEDMGVQNSEELPVENGKFSIVSFWGHSKSHNELQSVDFTDGTNSMFLLNAAALATTTKEMNRWYKVTCNPIEKIEVKTETANFSPALDFETLLKGDPEWDQLINFDLGFWDKEFRHYVIEKVFKGCKYEDGNPIFGNNFEKFTFTNIPLPNLTINDINKQVTLVPSWTCEMVQP